MSKFRFRVRRMQLVSMSVSALKEFAKSLDISLAGCLEKHEIVKKITESSRVVLVESSGGQSYSQTELLGMTPAELKGLMECNRGWYL